MKDDKKGSFTSGMVGATLGAAVGAAAAVLLSDKSKRDQILSKAKEIKEKASHKAAEMTGKLERTKEEVQQEAEKSVRQNKGKIRKLVSETGRTDTNGSDQ